MKLLNSPLAVFSLSFSTLWLAAQIGDLIRRKFIPFPENERDDLTVINGAILTLLGLLIGFAFSMAVTRYDQRKDYEEGEANAIGTAWVRADLLPDAEAAQVRVLLKKYLNARMQFYTTLDPQQLVKINADTIALQDQMWAVVRSAATAHPTPITALGVSAMNDVLNSQGYTQAAWWNRIPAAAWALMVVIAICCNVLLGYSARRTDRRLSVVLPLAVSLAFLLISDIDSPRGGAVNVTPRNLLSLAQSLEKQ